MTVECQDIVDSSWTITLFLDTVSVICVKSHRLTAAAFTPSNILYIYVVC